MPKEQTPIDIRVTVDAHTFLWAVDSASIFLAEFDPDVRRQIESYELPWGVPLHLTIGPDRVLIEAKVGRDRAIAEGNDLGNAPQPLVFRYCVPASVSGVAFQDGNYPIWILPSTLLAGLLHTENRERAAAQDEFEGKVFSGDVTLRVASTATLMQEYVEEIRRTYPDVSTNEEHFYRDRQIRVKREHLLECSFPGRRHRNRYCPVDMENRRLRRGDLELQPVQGAAVDFDKDWILAAGYHATVAGSDGVLIDMAGGRIVAPTGDGLFVVASAGGQAGGDGAASANASDAILARSLGFTPERLRAHIRIVGEAAVGSAIEGGRLSPDVLTAAAIRDIDSDAMDRLASDLVKWAESQLPAARLAPQECVCGGHERSAHWATDIIRAIAEQTAEAVDAGRATLAAAIEAWAHRVGRIRVETEAARDHGVPVPLRTLTSSGHAVVISPRMMFATALSALQAEDRYPFIEEVEIKRRSRVLHLAAAMAAADLGPELREELAGGFSLPLVAKARRGQASAKLLTALLKDIDEVGCQHVAARVMEWAQEKLPDSVFASHADRLIISHQGDRIRGCIAAAIELTDGDVAEELDRILSGAVGRARIESEVRARMAPAHPDKTPGEIQIDGGDFANVCFELVGKRSKFELDVRRTLDSFASIYAIPADLLERARRAMTATTPKDLAQRAPWAAWAEQFLERLHQSNVAGENLSLIESVRSSWAQDLHRVLERAGAEAEATLGISSGLDLRDPVQVDALGSALTATVKPNGRTLDFSNEPDIYRHASFSADRKTVNSIKLDDQREVTAARIAVDSTGRAVFSVISPDGRWGVSVADRSLEPRPEVFRERNGLTDEQLDAVLKGSRDLAQFIIPPNDLGRIANRVVDIADPRKGRSMRALLTVRWTGAESGAPEPEVGATVVDHTRTIEGYPLPGAQRPDPDAVGGHLRFYIFGDEGREVIDVPILDAFGVNIPGITGTSAAETKENGRKLVRGATLAAVIDARWFHEPAGFAAESAKRGVCASITADGALVFRDEAHRFAVCLPMADDRLIPDRERPLIERLSSGAVRRWDVDDDVIGEFSTESPGFDPRAFDPEIYAANEGKEHDALL